MSVLNARLRAHLSRRHEVEITVTGRKSGRRISIPVWFVLEDERIELLPVCGSDTQWYKNVLADSNLSIGAGDAQAEFKAIPITDRNRVSSVVEKFRLKYGADDLRKYYSKLDVAVLAEPR